MRQESLVIGGSIFTLDGLQGRARGIVRVGGVAARARRRVARAKGAAGVLRSLRISSVLTCRLAHPPTINFTNEAFFRQLPFFRQLWELVPEIYSRRTRSRTSQHSSGQGVSPDLP